MALGGVERKDSFRAGVIPQGGVLPLCLHSGEVAWPQKEIATLN